MKTGQEMKKGAGNMAGGMGKMFSGDFKGGAGQLFKGGGQMLLSGLKGTGALIKGLGSAVGIKSGVDGWSPSEARAKSVSQIAMAMRGKKPLLTGGGTFTQKKWQKGMAAAVKLGDNGPESFAMSAMMADIVRAFDVTPDIAQGFIYAALGANMDDETKNAIENEITKGWGRQVGKGGWQADYNAGRRDDSWKKFRSRSREAGGDAASQGSSSLLAAQSNSARLDRATAASAGGFTEDELKSLSLNNEYGTGLSKSGVKGGDVYLDGVIVGQVAVSAASEGSIDGLPSATIQRIGVDPT
jgi:hypothetical protein